MLSAAEVIPSETLQSLALRLDTGFDAFKTSAPIVIATAASS